MQMKWHENGFKSDLARVSGLGAAHSGPKHWLYQRLTGIANLILVIWLVNALLGFMRDGAEYGTVTLWLQSGINPVLMLLFILSVFYHAKLGLTVVIEDYIHHEGIKLATLIATKFIIVFCASICLFSVLKITL